MALVEPGRGGVRPDVVGVSGCPAFPRAIDGHRLTPDVERRVVSPKENGIFGQAAQALVSDGSQQRHGVVPRAAPQRRIDGPEEGRGLRIPRPREVVRERPQPSEAVGQPGTSRVFSGGRPFARTHVLVRLLASARVLAAISGWAAPGLRAARSAHELTVLGQARHTRRFHSPESRPDYLGPTRTMFPKKASVAASSGGGTLFVCTRLSQRGSTRSDVPYRHWSVWLQRVSDVAFRRRRIPGSL